MNTGYMSLLFYGLGFLLIAISFYKQNKMFKESEFFNEAYKNTCGEVLKSLKNIRDLQQERLNEISEILDEIDGMKIRFNTEVARVQSLGNQLEKKIESLKDE